MKIINIKNIEIPKHIIIIEVTDIEEIAKYAEDNFVFKYTTDKKCIYYIYNEDILLMYIDKKSNYY